MSISSTMNIYEKMLQKPKNRISTSGTIRQPTPSDTGIKTSVDEDAAYLADVDRRMALRQKGITEDNQNEKTSRITKLEKEVADLKNLMTEMMKTHMKLLGK